MTEYTTSSQAIREYMSSRERTAYWVQKHCPDEAEFYSPSVPPTELDGALLPSSPPSETGSSNSLPPRMVLRYNDGRPDIPIAPPEAMAGVSHSRSGRHHDDPMSPRSHNHSHSDPYHRARSGSQGTSPLSRSHSRRHDYHQSERSAPQVPEEIRVLPSHGHEAPQRSTSSSHQSRSKSLPRTADLPRQQEVPFIPPPIPPSHHDAAAPSLPLGPMHTPQQVTFAQPQWDPRTGRMAHPKHLPPSIIYAPSHHSNRPHYSPPAMYHHPPQMGPNGMIYSHSAPVRSNQYPAVGTPYPSVGGAPSHQGASLHDERERGSRRSKKNGSRRDQSRSVSRRRGNGTLHRSDSSSSLGSNNSGSTYYVLPSAGQKVHVISPSPQHSVHTATSTTKSATSPLSPSFKRPFFQRLFSIAGKFSSAHSTKGSVSGGSGKRLHRRHSTGGSGRRGRPEQPSGRLPT